MNSLRNELYQYSDDSINTYFSGFTSGDAVDYLDGLSDSHANLYHDALTSVINERADQRDEYQPTTINGHAVISYVRDHLPIDTRFINHAITSLPVDKYPTIELAVPMGSGKTEVIVDTCVTYGIQKLIVASSLKSIIDGIIGRFEEKKFPLGDYRKEIDFKKCCALAICCNSINKLTLNESELAEFTLVIDESESVFSQLALMEKTGNTSLEGDYDYLRTIIKHAKNVIVADANLGKLTANILMELRGDKPILRVSSTYLPGTGRSFTVWKDRGLLFEEVLKSLADGWQVIMPCDSITQIERFHAKMAAAGYNGIAITGDNKDDSQEAAFLANVDEELPKHQYVTYSPTLSTGVSIKAKDGQKIKVYGFFSSMSGPTPENGWQQIGRYRGLVDYNVHVDNRVLNEPVDFNECIKKIEFKAHATVAELTDEDFDPSEIQELTSIDAVKAFINKKLLTPYTALQASVMAKNNALNNNFLESLVKLAVEQGYTVGFKESDNEDELKAARVLMKEAKALSKADYIDKIMNAPEIDKAEASRIIGSDKRKSYEQRALDRYNIDKFYGEVTPEIVALDDRGDLRNKVRRVLRIANPSVALEKDISDIIDLFDGKKSISQLKAHKLYANVYRDMLAWAGYSFIDWELRHDGRVVTGKSLRSGGFIKWAKEQAKFVCLFHTIPKDFDERPIVYLQTFLGDLGLELTCKSVKTPDRVIREYHANEDKLKLIRRFI